MSDAQILCLTVLGLLGFTGFQQVFWMRNVQRLVDKSMSRSYVEYVQADNLKTLPKTKTKTDEKVKIQDDYATDQADRANRAFGLI